MPLPNPYLYILARNDLASLNAGKLAAQACHAANMAQEVILGCRIANSKRKEALDRLWKEWAGDRGFGTTIVLDAPFALLKKMTEANGGMIFNWEDNRPLIYGTVIDPSYPIRDGEVTHLIPLITCGFVFGDKDSIYVNNFTGSLNLFP